MFLPVIHVPDINSNIKLWSLGTIKVLYLYVTIILKVAQSWNGSLCLHEILFLCIYDKLNFSWILKPTQLLWNWNKQKPQHDLSCSFFVFSFPSRLPKFHFELWSHEDDNVHHRPVPWVTGILSTFKYGSV